MKITIDKSITPENLGKVFALIESCRVRMMAPLPVTATAEEDRDALEVAQLRTSESEKQNLENQHGYEGERLDIDIDGCRGESMFCKGTGIPWDKSVNKFKAPDALDHIQVRSTQRWDGRLIVRDRDVAYMLKKNVVFDFVLVVGTFPNYCIMGWRPGAEFLPGFGGDMSHREWRDAPNNRVESWFVPQEALNRDLDELLSRGTDGFFPPDCRDG